jgi:hypothetical protein
VPDEARRRDRLADVDRKILEQLIRRLVADMKKEYKVK